MGVNDIFTQIGNFWNRISVPILFHFIFLLLFVFVFGKVSIKSSIENYIKGQSFSRTKAILTEFELWKKLPLILVILLLIYLTLFNSVTDLISSVRVFPFNIAYSNQDFLKEYQSKENIYEIAKYGKDSLPDLFQVDQLKDNLLEEYKGKYPNKYDGWVKWANDQHGNRMRNFSFTAITILALFFFFIIRLFQNKTKNSKSFFKILLILILAFPVLFLLRYRAEQSIEERFSNEMMFVRTSLGTDTSRKPLLDSAKIGLLERKLDIELTSGKIYAPQLWVSRIVGESAFLQTILGERKLRNRVRGYNDFTY